MQTQTIAVPHGKVEEVLQPEIVYQVPDTVWVIDAETHQLLNTQEITVEQAMKVILIPKIAGG